MNEFRLREVCNLLTQDLDKSIGKKNIVRISADVKLPDAYEGSFIPTELLKKFATYISDNLINGLILIEIIKKSQIGDDVSVLFNISGSGIPEIGVSIHHKTQEQLRNDFQELNQGSDRDVSFSSSDSKISIEFSASLRVSSKRESMSQLVFHNRKVLIAEDNTINAMVFSSFLQDWGANGTIAENGQQAIDMVAAVSDYDLILMDIHMPVLNGIEATRQIRKLKPKLPIIVLSALVYDEAIREAIDAGANQFISKPVSSTDLYQALAKYL